MNDEELEARLQALVPAHAPRALRARLEKPPARRPRWRWVGWVAPLAAAASVAIALIPRPQAPIGAAPPSVRRALPSDFRVFIPIEGRCTLVDVSNFSVIPAGSDNLVRLVRCTWLDDVTYRGDDGATLHRAEPREQLIPVPLESL